MRGAAARLWVLLLLVTATQGAVITGACERDAQCGPGTCCAISLWLRGLRVCTPLGREGEACHPGSHKVPYSGRRRLHACPCRPALLCSRHTPRRHRCSADWKNLRF